MLRLVCSGCGFFRSSHIAPQLRLRHQAASRSFSSTSNAPVPSPHRSRPRRAGQRAHHCASRGLAAARLRGATSRILRNWRAVARDNTPFDRPFFVSFARVFDRRKMPCRLLCDSVQYLDAALAGAGCRRKHAHSPHPPPHHHPLLPELRGATRGSFRRASRSIKRGGEAQRAKRARDVAFLASTCFTARSQQRPPDSTQRVSRSRCP